MRDRTKSNRHTLLRGPGGRRVTIQPGGRSYDIAAEIAQKVIQMSSAEVEALIASRGLTHLTNPDRIAAILGMTSDGGAHDDAEDDINAPPASQTAAQAAGGGEHTDSCPLKRVGRRQTRR